MANEHIAVLDIGKTLSKLTLWTSEGEQIRREAHPNGLQQCGAYDALDHAGIEAWLLATLREFSSVGAIGSIIPVGHGAGVAALKNSARVAPPMDYEFPIPAKTLAAYRQQRDPFENTGSPALPDGLNFGAQLHYLETRTPGLFEGATLVPWAQYWAWFLTGAATTEVTSLGCHSDVWRPREHDYSDLAKKRGWAEKFAPLKKAGDVAGVLRPEIAAATGLSPSTKVHCGLHDSNAALVAARGFTEIAAHDATVLSTGTWFVAMRAPKDAAGLPVLQEARDCLFNVDIAGNPVPSARFMGGREIETLIGLDTRRVDIKPDQPALLGAVGQVVESGAMVLPTLAAGFGPFPHGRGRWIKMPDDWFARRACACLYAALVADAALDLIGAKDVLLIEGRFAEAEVFVRALAALRPSMSVYTANAHNDVSFGALRVLDPSLKPKASLVKVEPLNCDLSGYRSDWRRHAGQAEDGQ